jgi:hypothetical protein
MLSGSAWWGRARSLARRVTSATLPTSSTSLKTLCASCRASFYTPPITVAAAAVVTLHHATIHQCTRSTTFLACATAHIAPHPPSCTPSTLIIHAYSLAHLHFRALIFSLARTFSLTRRPYPSHAQHVERRVERRSLDRARVGAHVHDEDDVPATVQDEPVVEHLGRRGNGRRWQAVPRICRQGRRCVQGPSCGYGIWILHRAGAVDLIHHPLPVLRCSATHLFVLRVATRADGGPDSC